MIARIAGSGDKVSTYTVREGDMASGSTLGGPKGAVQIKANGAIEKFYSSDAGTVLVGGVQVAFWDHASGVVLGSLPGHVVIHPDRQERVYELINGILVHETILLQSGPPQIDAVDPLIAYYHVTLENTTGRKVVLDSIAAALLRGGTPADVRVSYDAGRDALIAVNRSNPDLARAFGASRRPTSYEVTSDHGKCSRPSFPGRLLDRICRNVAEPIGLLHHHYVVRPHGKAELTYTLAGTSDGRRRLRSILDGRQSFGRACAWTRRRYDDILRRAVVMTPDQEVNRGVLWAKVNMLRTMLYSPTGWCFVNDPTRSNNSVCRDTAWFAFGSDYVTPDFSRESLRWYVDHLEKTGMAVEYYDVRTGKSEDYGLNVNDNTPLLLWALWHHYNATGDIGFLRYVYPKARKAANFLLGRRNDRGLVWCTAAGTADWGIVGWRNVIAGYRLSGATTELNSECYAAVAAVGKMARKLGDTANASRFEREASALRDAINTHLVDPDTGLYYLTIDLDGTPRSDVTCDMVFPVMFGVADPDRAARIVGRLSMEPFWSEAGIRTIPRNDINYGPTHGYGLLGGVWVGVTFWYAFAASKFNPEFMATSLSRSFRHYSSNPRANNTVPGQFSEWLHGDTLVNEGMMLSPWFPPRYLWAAIEGAAGLDLSGDEPTCNPHLAPDWRWLAVRRLRFRGGYVSWFVVRMPELKMYADFRFGGSHEYEAYDEDVTDRVLRGLNDEVTGVALRRGGEIMILIANTSERSVMAPLVLHPDLRGRFSIRTFSSMRMAWSDVKRYGGKTLHAGLSVQLDRKGFCLFDVRRHDGE